MDVLSLLKTLTSTPGPSGLEQDVATVVAEMWQPYADDVRIDHMGNLYATKYGSASQTPRRKLLLTAHMDEIALMVTKVVAFDGYGFLRVTNVGGVDRRQLYGQQVVVHGKRNLPGVIGGVPNSMLPPDRRGKAYSYEELFVDVGSSAEIVQETVSVGDFVSFHRPLIELQNGRVATKALDNRACVAALTIALEHLAERNHSWDVVVAATIQEETRLLGGYITSHVEKPDIAVALDVSFAKQPGANEITNFELGSGPVLDIGVNVHPAVFKRLQGAATSLEMKVSKLPHSRASGTEAAALQVARGGIPTGLVSMPLRYMHTMVETIALKDIERTGRLVAQFAAELDDDVMPAMQKALLRE